MRIHFSFVLLAALLVAADTPEEAIKAEKKSLEGAWVLESVEIGGKADEKLKKAEVRMVFSGDKITMSKDGKDHEGSYTIDPSKKPKQIDLTIKGPDGREGTLGVYELDGDTLRITASSSSATAKFGKDGKVTEVKRVEGKRPEKVDSTTGMLLIFKREKK